MAWDQMELLEVLKSYIGSKSNNDNIYQTLMLFVGSAPTAASTSGLRTQLHAICYGHLDTTGTMWIKGRLASTITVCACVCKSLVSFPHPSQCDLLCN